jgi:hypothetical protein
LQLIKEAAEQTSLDMRFVWQPDQGMRLTRSRNNGVRCARGDILVFVDGDTVVPPNFLSAHASLHSGGPTIVSGTRSRSWIDGDVPIDRNTPIGTQIAEFAERAILPSLDQIWASANSPLLWTDCLGTNFSVTRSDLVVFDERLVGW